jgi:hypothetical protein
MCHDQNGQTFFYMKFKGYERVSQLFTARYISGNLNKTETCRLKCWETVPFEGEEGGIL